MLESEYLLMIQKSFAAVLILYFGLLLGEVPLGDTTVGRTAWRETNKALQWSHSQAQTFISYAGWGGTKPAAVAAPKIEKPELKKQEKPIEPVEEFTSNDKEALRQILEQ